MIWKSSQAIPNPLSFLNDLLIRRRAFKKRLNDEMREDQQAIRERAHKLWEQAGKPERKEDQFWFEAERQLAEERIRHELKTPDNL